MRAVLTCALLATRDEELEDGVEAAEDSVQRGLYRNPYLMEQPDRADPAACFVGVTGWVFRGLLRQH